MNLFLKQKLEKYFLYISVVSVGLEKSYKISNIGIGICHQMFIGISTHN